MQSPESGQRSRVVATDLPFADRPKRCRRACGSTSKAFSAVSRLIVALFLTTWVQSTHGQLNVSTTPHGDPTWRPSEAHLFTGCVSNSPCFSEFLDTIRLPDGAATPPYDSVLADGMELGGVVDSDRFFPNDIEGRPTGTIFSIAFVPDPGITGSSILFESGPVLSRDLLPIRTDVDLLREGRIVDGDFSTKISFPPEVLPSNVDGLAWLQQFYASGQIYFPRNTNLVGSYEWRAELRDQGGQGWDIAVPFDVFPVLPGDFNNDDSLDAGDIDLLAGAIGKKWTGAVYDANEDGQVNNDDLAHWVHGANFGNTYFGDANLDGEFNSGDMIEVFQAGKYELDMEAGWAHGDWTGDQRFDTGDMVAAFQDGGYELGSRAAVSAVPEPSSAALLVIGVIGLCRLRKRR